MFVYIYIYACIYICLYIYTYVCIYIYMYMFVYIYTCLYFFSSYNVKARAIPCPHQPPSRGDNTVSVAQGGTAILGATKQLLQPDRVLRESYIYIYIYIYASSIKYRDYIGR